MILSFQNIWNIIVRIISKTKVTYWKIFGALFGFVICLLLLINVNKIRNQYVECYAYADVDGVRTENLVLNFRTNHAMQKNEIYNDDIDPTISGFVSFIDDGSNIYVSDSTKHEFVKAFGELNERVNDIKYAYDFRCVFHNDQPQYFASRKPLYDFKDFKFCITEPIEIIRKSSNIKNRVAILHYKIASSLCVIQLADTKISIFNNRPSLLTLRDVSQCVYTYKVFTDSESVQRLSFDFMGVVNFSNMYPSPDKITMTGMEFTDSIKLNNILSNGITFHSSFPQARNLQTIRVSILSLFLSLFFSLSVSMISKMIKENFKQRRTKKEYEYY